MNERRIKILSIRHKDFVNLLALLNGKNIVRIAADDLPTDVVMLSVFEDPFTDCFMAKMYHESFPVIEEGAQTPIVNCSIWIVE